MRNPGDVTGPEATPTVVVEAEPGLATVTLPADGGMLDADYARVGADLLIEQSGEPSILVRGYFDGEPPASLATPDGASLSGDTIVRLAGPLAPAQLAQSGSTASSEPIGKVTELTGSAEVTRTNGVEESLSLGDSVYLGDVLRTGADSTLGITFIDDTLFSLGADARLLLNDLIFDPAGANNALSLSLVTGAFAFVSGQIAGSDGPGMAIETPVATIGVRGTTGTGAYQAVTQTLVVALVQSADGTTGIIDISNLVDSQTLLNALDAITVNNANAPISDPTTLTPQQLASFATALASATTSYIQLLQQQLEPEAPPESQQGDASGSDRPVLTVDTNADETEFGDAPEAVVETPFGNFTLEELIALFGADPNLILLLGLPAPQFATLLVETALGLEAQQGPEGGDIFLQINVQQNDQDGAGEELTIALLEVPPGVEISNANGLSIINDSEDPIGISLQIEDLDGLRATPPDFDDADFILVVRVTTFEPAIPGLQAVSQVDLPVNVQAVADLAELLVNGLTAPAGPQNLVALVQAFAESRNPVQIEQEGQGVIGLDETIGTAQDLGSLDPNEAGTALTVNGWAALDPDADELQAIDPLPDLDVYKFTLDDAGQIRLDIDFAAADEGDGTAAQGRIDAFDAVMALYDETGLLLGISDDGGDGDPFLDLALGPGMYFVAVMPAANAPLGQVVGVSTFDEGFAEGTGGDNVGDYRLQVRAQADDILPGERFAQTEVEDNASEQPPGSGMYGDAADITKAADFRFLTVDPDGSESITRIQIGVRVTNEGQDFSDLPGFMIDFGAGSGFVPPVPVGGTVSIDALVFNPLDPANPTPATVQAGLEFDPGAGIPGVGLFVLTFDESLRVQEVDLSGLRWKVEQHDDHDFDFELVARTTETHPSEGDGADTEGDNGTPGQVAIPHNYKSATLSVETEAVADKPTVVLTGATVVEDVGNPTAGAPPTAGATQFVVTTGLAVDTVDRDGTEGITEIQISFTGIDFAGILEDAFTLFIDGVEVAFGSLNDASGPLGQLLGLTVTIFDSATEAPSVVQVDADLALDTSDPAEPTLTLTFPDNDEAGEASILSVDWELAIRTPQHEAEDFTIHAEAEVTEVNPNGPVAVPTARTVADPVEVVIQEVADAPIVALTGATVLEDVGTPPGPVPSAVGTPFVVQTGLTVDAVDTDGSEGVTEIRITFGNIDFGGLLEADFGLTIDGQAVDFASLNGTPGALPGLTGLNVTVYDDATEGPLAATVNADVTLVDAGGDPQLVLTFPDNDAFGDDPILNVDWNIVFSYPEHEAEDFTIDAQATSTEFNPDPQAGPVDTLSATGTATQVAVVVNEVADVPTVTLQDFAADEDAAAVGGVTATSQLTADTVDRDGSEGLTEVRLTFGDVDFDGLLEGGFSLTIDGRPVDFASLNGGPPSPPTLAGLSATVWDATNEVADGTATVDASLSLQTTPGGDPILVLSFDGNDQAGEASILSLDWEIALVYPEHEAEDFTLSAEADASEINPDGPVDTATATGSSDTVNIVISEAADAPIVALTGAAVLEDVGNPPAPVPSAVGTPFVVQTGLTVDAVDTDGSEGITEIRLTFGNIDFAGILEGDFGLTIGDQPVDFASLNGAAGALPGLTGLNVTVYDSATEGPLAVTVNADVTLVDASGDPQLVLTFPANDAFGDDPILNVDWDIVFSYPEHEAEDFTIDAQATSTEFNPDPQAGPVDTLTTTGNASQVAVVVSEVTDTPTVALSEFTAVDEDAVQGGGPLPQASAGVTVSSTFQADTVDRDGSEGLTEVRFTFGDVDFAGILEGDFSLTIDGLSVDFASLNGGPPSPLTLTGLSATVWDATNEVEDATASVDASLSLQTTPGGDPILVLSFDGNDQAGETSILSLDWEIALIYPEHEAEDFTLSAEADADEINPDGPSTATTATGSSDTVSIVVQEVADAPTVGSSTHDVTEDFVPGPIPASQQDGSEGPLMVTVPITASVNDSDGSEGLTEIRLGITGNDGDLGTRGFSIDIGGAPYMVNGARNFDDIELDVTLFDGTPDGLAGTATASLVLDLVEGELVLTFADNDGTTAPQILAVATDFKLTYPQHDADDFTITVEALASEVQPDGTVSQVSASASGSGAIVVREVADVAVITGPTDALITYCEDNADLAGQGAAGDQVFELPITVATQDRDGSEGIKSVKFSLTGLATGFEGWTLNGSALTDGSTETIGGVSVGIAISGQMLTLTYADGDAPLDLDLETGDLIGVELAEHFSGSFDVDVEVTTKEVGADGLISVETATVSDSFTVTVEGVADTVTPTANDVTVNEDEAITFDIAAALSDADGSETLEVTVTGIPADWTLQAGSPGTFTAGTWTSGALPAGTPFANPTFQPPANFHTAGAAVALTVAVTTVESGTVKAGEDQASDNTTFTYSIDPVNDPVAASGPAAQTVDENTTVASSLDLGGLFSFTDVDTVLTPGGIYEITLTAEDGVVSLDGGADQAVVTMQGTIAAIGAALADLVFTPTFLFVGDASLSFSVTDLVGTTVATGSGADTSDEVEVTITVEAVDDIFASSAADETIQLGGGNDQITVERGDGFDLIDGGSELDLLIVEDIDDATPNTSFLIEDATTHTALTVGFDDFGLKINGVDAVHGAGIEDISVVGNAGNDTLTIDGDFSGTAIASSTFYFEGGAGFDLLDASGLTSAHAILAYGNGSDDTLIGGAGDDELLGGAQDDSLFGGDGNDSLQGQGENDVLSGGDGDDELLGGAGDDALDGDGDDDTLFGGGANDALSGSGGDDTLFGGDGADRITHVSGDGFDLVDGGGVAADSDELILSDPGAGSPGTSFLIEDAATHGGLTTGFDEFAVKINGSDAVHSTGIEEISVVGGGGNDTLTIDGDFSSTAIASSTFFFEGGAGVDLLDASGLTSDHSVEASGGGGSDTLIGGAGDDSLFGGTGDSLIGGAGDDLLTIDDAGFASLDGGTGDDTLALDGAFDLDLTLFANGLVVNVGNVEMTNGGANRLSLDLEDVVDMAGAAGTLVVRGDAALDEVSLQLPPAVHPNALGTWVLAATGVANGGDSFDQYEFVDGGPALATVLVETGVAVSGLSGGLSGDLALASVIGGTATGISGFRFAGEAAGDYTGQSVASAGDVDGDGFDDFLIGAPSNDPNGAAAGFVGAGAAYLVFGGQDFAALDAADGTADGSLALANVGAAGAAGIDGFRLTGESESDAAGTSLSAAGDVNGDGFGDLLVGAANYDDGTSQYGGAAYLVLGGQDFATLDAADGSADGDLSLANVGAAGAAGIDGFRVTGYAYDQAGTSVSSAGDINGDGFDDLLIGAPVHSYDGYDRGATFVVFGGQGLSGDVFSGDLGSTVLGFRLSGRTYDEAGTSVSAAGDINGDGIDDLLVGAPNHYDDYSYAYSGASYLVFGGQDFAALDVADGITDGVVLLDNVGGGSSVGGFRLLGEDTEDRSGFSVSAAGDVNGDGIGDLLIGSPDRDVGGTDDGTAYVVFGGQDFATLDGADAAGLDGALELANIGVGGAADIAGFRLTAEASDDRAGVSVAAAGDVNGDGIDDILVGASYNDENGANAGATYVIFGGQGLSGTISLGDIEDLGGADSVEGFRLTGEASGDTAGQSVSAAGDVNGDGFDDLLIGAPHADDGSYSYAGVAYILFGGDFTSSADSVAGAGSQTLTGDSGGNILIGGGGSDQLEGGGGADVLYGGEGDDDLEIGDAGFQRVDGGGGQDTLVLDGAFDLDFTAVANIAVTDVEAIDSDNGVVNNLTLSLEDVFALSSIANADVGSGMTANSLLIDGDSLDSVDLTAPPGAHPSAAGAWVMGAGTVTVGTEDYVEYSFDLLGSSLATVLVHEDVSVTIPVTIA